MTAAESRFAFGDNWQTYANNHLTADAVAQARESLQEAFGVESMSGQRFLDIGCGSGLFSLAAAELGATVHAFDYDADSVAITRRVLADSPTESDHVVEQADVLDESFMADLGEFELVYCWGVAHHTGDLWSALENVFVPVADDGRVVVAVYRNDEEGFITSEQWRGIKRRYVNGGRLLRTALLAWYVAYWSAWNLKDGKNPIREARAYDGEGRGMSFWTDVKDWLGGYPYEFASADEVQSFVESETDFELTRLDESDGNGCNEFTFVGGESR